MHSNAESHLGTYLYLFSALVQLLALEVWHEIVLMAMMILLVCFSSQCFVCENVFTFERNFVVSFCWSGVVKKQLEHK